MSSLGSAALASRTQDPLTEARTLDKLFDSIAAQYPQTQCRFPADDAAISMSELAELSTRLAAGLAREGVVKGSLVGLLFPNSREFLVAFFAVLRLGAVAAALPLPASASALQEFGRRVQTILRDGRVRHVVVHERFMEMAALIPDDVSVLTFGDEIMNAAEPPAPTHLPTDLAFIQYTSGSTSAPKGVALSHANISAGLRAIVTSSEMKPDDVMVQWLPLYHDMGLFGMLASLSCGATTCVWPPSAFIRNPAKWLRNFVALGGTLYTGPNFSYEYMLDNVSERDLGQLDLRRWRLAYNGAESINYQILTRFIEYFGRAGFRPQAMFPVYGMAEVTLAATFPPVGRGLRVHWVDRDLLANLGEVRFVDRDDPRARAVVACGHAVFAHEVRIGTVDTGQALGESRVGEIQVRGPAVMCGYLNKPEVSAESFHDGWLKTGDLGYMSEGELFVTGRKKELIIMHGENYYPQDIEAALHEIPDIYRSRCIAVATLDEHGERLSVLAETGVTLPEKFQALAEEIRATVTKQLGLGRMDVHLLKRRSILRTTSGKYQRLLMAQQLRDKRLGELILYSLKTD